MGMLLNGPSGQVIMGRKRMRVRNWAAVAAFDRPEPWIRGELSLEWDDGAEVNETVSEWRAGKLVGLNLRLGEEGRFFLTVAKAVIRETPSVAVSGSNITLGIRWAAQGRWSMPSRRR